MRVLLYILVFLQLNFSAQDLLVQSTAFANRHYIPYRYTCDAENVNPGLTIGKIPTDAKSLVLIMIDTSAAFGEFDHWIVWNLPTIGKINEKNSAGVTGLNSRKENKYTGPCPPNGEHEYQFRVYALNTLLDIPASSDKISVMKAMQGHILAKGVVVGLFQRE